MIFWLLFLSFSSIQAKELKSSDFYICIKKTATNIQSRNIRIHQFEKAGKCIVLYSVNGKDQILFTGKWLRSCKKKASQAIQNLEKSLWDCKKQPEVQVLYSF